MSDAVVVLGSSTAVVTAERDNTALAFRMEGASVLVDCPGSPGLKLRRAGIDPLDLDAVVITHTHPDHVYGLPSLVHNLRLLGRRTALPVFAQAGDLDRIGRLLAVFGLDTSAAFVDLRPIIADGATPFWEHAGHRLYALPVDHGVPACAVRWDSAAGARAVYSSDTRPMEALATFGRGAALLIHEATFSDAEAERARASGHSTAGDAGRIADLAGARRLLLVHLTDEADPAQWTAEARKTFGGPVEVPDDGAVYALS
ncbi:MAG: MBL fold metallo-hydrolase [Armatimonadota bacterium]|nr:MBL fold metallo-hydrolase [Armatimonadota bacterium]MDR7518987.1 MBL fold metallo-hydrolase [Armatimonadota bacterium]MDR7548894.1 MBL fold metallo-hydrolase [Armatimonadota bacterium]